MSGIHAKRSFEDPPSSRLVRDYGGARKPVPKRNEGTSGKEGNWGTRPSLSLRGVAALCAIMSINVFAETPLFVKTVPEGVVSVEAAGAPSPEFQLFAAVEEGELENGGASYDEVQQIWRIQRRFHTKDGQNGCVITQVLRRHETGLRWELSAEGMGGPWSAPLELHLRWRESGTTQFWTAWSDPLQGNKGWNDPLVFQSLQDREWFYGAPPFEEDTPRTGYCPLIGNTFCIPLAVISDSARDQAVSLILSPEDRLLDLTLRSTANGEVVFSHINHRLEQGKPFSFSADLVVHKADWRAALGWMAQRYPQYFNPPNPRADELAGCGAYSSYEGPLDVEKFKRMAFRINWKASFDFPYMGMFLPPVQGDQDRWRRFDVDSSGRRVYGKYTETSRAQMAEYAERMEGMGFHVLSYFNVTEFGTDIKGPDTARKDVPETDLWKNANDFLYGKIADGILHNASGGTWGTWGGAVAMDPAGPNYQAHLLEQARMHIEKIPASPGICIDRLDWLRFYNPQEDDGLSWRNGQACRSLFTSWRDIIGKLSPMMHGANKVIFVNNHLKRIDLLREVDGIYCEFAQNGRALNSTGLLTLRKPALGWTASEQDLKPDPDALFQRHLHMGVYPTAPVTGNDHTIPPSDFAEPYYLDYGPLLDALRGKKWVLQPHVIEVEGNTAKANIFEVSSGVFVIPVTFGGKAASARIILHELPAPSSATQWKAETIYPGNTAWTVMGTIDHQDTLSVEISLQRGCALLRLSAVVPPGAKTLVPEGITTRGNLAVPSMGAGRHTGTVN